MATTFNCSEQKMRLTLDKVHKKAGGTKLKYTEDLRFDFFRVLD